jgi:hypothetical protein
MIPTTSTDWRDRSLSNDHVDQAIKKRDPGRQEGAATEKAVPFPTRFLTPTKRRIR